jgi:hypothetical protein
MATSNPAIEGWATQSIGKAVRIATAVLGMVAATAILALSPLVANGSWIMIVTGLALVITSVRVAVKPTLSRIGMLAVPTAVIPFLTQLL